MHRLDTDTGLGTDGPPGTSIPSSNWNALQEEIAYVIEQANLTLNTAAQDDGGARTQLYNALVSAAHLVNMGLTATTTEINTACDGITASAIEINRICDSLLFPSRAQFTHVDDDTINIGAGVYIHHGTTSQMVYWNTAAPGLVLDMTGLTNNNWYYVYIDDSAVVTAGTNLLTASEFTYNDTAPAWDDTKKGWYNGSDLCIFAFKTDATGDILKFHHSNDLVMDDIENTNELSGNIATDWSSTATLWFIPEFCTKAEILVAYTRIDVNSTVRWRQGSSSSTDGLYIGDVDEDDPELTQVITVITDSSRRIDVKDDDAGSNTIVIYTHGWYFPIGM